MTAAARSRRAHCSGLSAQRLDLRTSRLGRRGRRSCARSRSVCPHRSHRRTCGVLQPRIELSTPVATVRRRYRSCVTSATAAAGPAAETRSAAPAPPHPGRSWVRPAATHRSASAAATNQTSRASLPPESVLDRVSSGTSVPSSDCNQRLAPRRRLIHAALPHLPGRPVARLRTRRARGQVCRGQVKLALTPPRRRCVQPGRPCRSADGR